MINILVVCSLALHVYNCVSICELSFHVIGLQHTKHMRRQHLWFGSEYRCYRTAKGSLVCWMWPRWSVQFSSSVVSNSYLDLVELCCMDCSTPGLPVHHQLPEFTQTHVHWVGDAIQPSHSLPSLPLPPSIFPASGSFQMNHFFISIQFSLDQSLSHVRLFPTLWIAACQASLSITNSWNLLKLMSIESVMPSNHLILCHPLLLLPSIFPRIRIFSSESALRIR